MTFTESQCPPTARYRELLAGRLDEAVAVRIEDHAASCPTCLNALKESLEGDDTLNGLAKPSTVVEQRQSPVVGMLIQKLRMMNEPPLKSIAFACSGCGKKMKVRAELAGKKVKCPGCARVAVVPVDDPTQAFSQGGPHSQSAVDETAVDENESWDFLAAPRATGEIGRLGEYRVLKVLGRGGMGVVFLAEDVLLRRPVALKAMLPTVAASPSAKKRFLREAQTAARIQHDHIVTIHQVGEAPGRDDRGVPFLAMEFLHGEPLDGRLKREGKLPVDEVLRIGQEIAEGLAAAHDAGLVHRDVKPANIWLESRKSGPPRVKILDFGLARSTDDQQNLTQSGAIVGTPAYMSPEQTQGGQIDRRSDLFSLGCVLYVMATGEPPFRGKDTISILMSVATTEAPAPLSLNPQIPADLSALIMRLLAKNPDDRPQNAGQVAAAILAIESRSSVPVTPARNTTAEQPASKRTKPRRAVLAVCGALLLVAAIVASAVFLIPKRNGVIRIEINDNATQVTLTKTGAIIKGKDKEHDITIAPGQHALRVQRDGLDFETDAFTVKNGETVVLKVDHLKDKVVVMRDGEVIGQQVTAKIATWQPTAEQQAYLDGVARLSKVDRIESVKRKMAEINAAFERPEVALTLEPADEPTTCTIADSHARDFWPLAALMSLRELDLTGTTGIDFTPLSRLPLVHLKLPIIIDNVDSERALESIASLRTINGMDRQEFFRERAAIRKEIDDIAAVSKGLSLKDRMVWFGTMMKKLNPACSASFTAGGEPDRNQMSLWMDAGQTRFFARSLVGDVFDFSPVRALGIDSFAESGGRFYDATPLKTLPLKSFSIRYNYDFRDLSPLAGGPLEMLELQHLNSIGDPRLLSGMKLKAVLMPAATDLTVFKGLPLERLMVGPARDFSPLKGMPLKHLVFEEFAGADRAAMAAIFRELPLVEINGMPATQFHESIENREKR